MHVAETLHIQSLNEYFGTLVSLPGSTKGLASISFTMTPSIMNKVLSTHDGFWLYWLRLSWVFSSREMLALRWVVGSFRRFRAWVRSVVEGSQTVTSVFKGIDMMIFQSMRLTRLMRLYKIFKRFPKGWSIGGLRADGNLVQLLIGKPSHDPPFLQFGLLHCPDSTQWTEMDRSYKVERW